MSTTALYQALLKANVPEDLAERAVEGLSTELATKADITGLRAELKTDIAELRTELIKWVVGINFVGWGIVIAAVGLMVKF